ncbi:MAG: DUF4097 family beta strand repeat-containing protein [Candidatus Bipolaricaulia bacterium]
MKRRVLGMGLVLGALALLFLAGCIPSELATRELTESFIAVEGGVELEVGSSNGRVTVQGVEGQTSVVVTATLRSRGETMAEAMVRVAQINVEMTQVGNRISLRYDAGDHPLNVGRYSGVDFDVTVPTQVNVDADTSNGRIEIQDVSGVLVLETSNGKVGVSDSIAEVHAQTSNGGIEIDHVVGILDLDTSNGRIEMESIEGVVDAETSNGAIWFSGMLISDVAHRMVTSNGRIDLAIRSDASLIINASTSNASIVSTLPLVGDTEGKEWSAVLNPPATGTLTLRTSNGQIEMHGIF